MRFIITILLCVLIYDSTIAANSNTTINIDDKCIRATDSLLQKLELANINQKADIYRDLADIYLGTPQAILYLKEIYAIALKTLNRELQVNMLGEIAEAYIRNNQIDSGHHYIKIIEGYTGNKQTIEWNAYLKMCLFNAEIYQKDKKSNIDVNFDNSSGKAQSLYEQIGQAYIVGSGLIKHNKYEEALPYLKTAYDLCDKITGEPALKFRLMTTRILANCYLAVGKAERRVEILENVLKMQILYYEKYYKSNRPFYNINSQLIQYYSYIISCISVLPDKKTALYMQKLLELTKNSTNLKDRYNRYISMNNYYLHRAEYAKAQSANDSLIKLAYKVAPYNLPKLYEVSCSVYEIMGKNKEALESMKMFIHVKDSLISNENELKINELQVKYDVDKLNYEKAQAEIHNKRILLVVLAIGLILVVIVCVYLFCVFKKEKYLKNELHKLNIKAEESERMKSAFISSMSHEIRTPLNAIVGFSNLMFDNSLDIDSRKEFPDLIKKNTFILTSLIDNMFEIANLDSSQENLPCEHVGLNKIITKEMERIRTFPKPNVKYIFDIPTNDVTIYTHPKYFGLVIGAVLDNAYKFTENGSVLIIYNVDKLNRKLCVSVTDTGCGISLNNMDSIFDRFFKLNAFVSGSGLGLYLCKLIMSKLNGSISIDKKYTTGARFIIELPYLNI